MLPAWICLNEITIWTLDVQKESYLISALIEGHRSKLKLFDDPKNGLFLSLEQISEKYFK